MQTPRKWSAIFKGLKGKLTSLEFSIQWNHCSKVKEKQRLPQLNKTSGNLSPVVLACKKYEKLFREEENNLGQKVKFTQGKEED